MVGCTNTWAANGKAHWSRSHDPTREPLALRLRLSLVAVVSDLERSLEGGQAALPEVWTIGG